MNWLERIPWNELEFTAARSRGPGGQNVNKTNSAVQLRFNVKETLAFTDQERSRLLEKLESRLTTTGDLLIRSEESRDQDQNRKNCLRKLTEILDRAYHRQAPRKKTKPTRSSVRKRVESKKRRSEVKQTRAKVGI